MHEVVSEMWDGAKAAGTLMKAMWLPTSASTSKNAAALKSGMQDEGFNQRNHDEGNPNNFDKDFQAVSIQVDPTWWASIRGSTTARMRRPLNVA